MAVFSQVQVTTITDQFNGSGGVRLGPDGFLYVADYGSALPTPDGTTVWRINRVTGEREVFATGMSGASGNDFDSEGNYYQSNIGFGSIKKITPSGTITTFATGFNVPIGCVVDSEGNVYVANHSSNIVHKVSPAGTVSVLASGSPLNCPNGLTIDGENNLYTSNFSDNRVVKITPDGTMSILGEMEGNSNGHLIYSEAHDALFVTSHGSHRLFHVTLDGTVTTIAGTGARGNNNGDALTEATFSRPNGIAVSLDGDTLWVNSSIPVTDVGFPLNPSVIRMITGLNDLLSPTNELGPFNIAVNISPNPAADIVHINMELKTRQNLTINILDNMGKTVFSKNMGEVPAGPYHRSVSIEGFPAGLYYLAIMGKDFSVTKKLMVE